MIRSFCYSFALCVLCVLCGETLFSATAQAALKPPPGFAARAGENGRNARACQKAPAPFTGALKFPSKYEGSGKARDQLNPKADAKYKAMTEPIRTIEREISAHVGNYVETGREEGVRCALDWLGAWAEAGALLSTDADHTGKSMRKWALASIASSYVRLKFSQSRPLEKFPERVAEIEAWLGRLADLVVEDWGDQPLKKFNNHEYWAAWAVMATAVALDRRPLFEWAADQYRMAADQVDAEGYLPNELRRETRALYYHNYSLGPLSMIAAFAKANGVDLARANGGALQRLGDRVLSGLDRPDVFQQRTGHKQNIEELQDTQSKLSWLEPYCWVVQCSGPLHQRVDALRPLKTYRLGGDLTYLFTRRVTRG